MSNARSRNDVSLSPVASFTLTPRLVESRILSSPVWSLKKKRERKKINIGKPNTCFVFYNKLR